MTESDIAEERSLSGLCLSEHLNKTGNVCITTLMHIRATTIEVEKQKVLHIVSMCL